MYHKRKGRILRCGTATLLGRCEKNLEHGSYQSNDRQERDGERNGSPGLHRPHIDNRMHDPSKNENRKDWNGNPNPAARKNVDQSQQRNG